MDAVDALRMNQWTVQTDTPETFRATRNRTISTFNMPALPESHQDWLLPLYVEIDAPAESGQYSIKAGLCGAPHAGVLWQHSTETRDAALTFLNQELLPLDDDAWIAVFVDAV